MILTDAPLWGASVLLSGTTISYHGAGRCGGFGYGAVLITDKRNVLMRAAARQDVVLRWVSPSQCLFDVSSVPTYFGRYCLDTYLSQYLKDFGRNEVYSCDRRLGSPTIRLTPIGYRAGQESGFFSDSPVESSRLCVC